MKNITDFDNYNDYSDIIDYIREKYKPHTVIVYGSRADGSYTSDSDFDALVISDTAKSCSDDSFVGDIELDLSVYNTRQVGTCLSDFDRLTCIYGGIPVIDEKGIGAELLRCVGDHIERSRIHSSAEKVRLAEWCAKMLVKSEAGGVEGDYRRCRLMTDSLEVYFIMRDLYFFGPMKSLCWLKENAPAHYSAYTDALHGTDDICLKRWIDEATGFHAIEMPITAMAILK